jgi:predicted ATPase with chaperone activity
MGCSRREGYGVSSPPKGAPKASRIWVPPPCIRGVHTLLRLGAPGADTSMVARLCPTILPDLTLPEAIETTRIHSVAGLTGDRTGRLTSRRSAVVLTMSRQLSREIVVILKPSWNGFTKEP